MRGYRRIIALLCPVPRASPILAQGLVIQIDFARKTGSEIGRNATKSLRCSLHMLDRQHAGRGFQRAGDRRADGVAAGQADFHLLLRPDDDDQRHLAFAGRA